MARRPSITKKIKKQPRKKLARTLVTGNASGNIKVPDLKIKDPDILHYGPEPNFEIQPNPDHRQKILSDTWAWYSHFCDPEDAKEFTIRYATDILKLDKPTIAILKKASDIQFITTIGWTCRAASRGLILSDVQKDRILAMIDSIIANQKPSKSEEAPKPKRAVNVQETMRERADEAASTIEILFDDFIIGGCKPINFQTKIVGAFTERNIMAQHVGPILRRWEKILHEYRAAIDPKNDDSDLKEGFKTYSKAQMKAKIAFCENVIADLNGYLNLKQIARKPRAKKIIPVEKIVANFKYLKKFENFTSESPVKIQGATEIWLYDVAKRKIVYYTADDYSKSLSIKGTTVLGFDKAKSFIKTIRKPTEFLSAFMKSGRPASRKLVAELKTVAIVPNGRSNADMLILKAW